MLIPTEIRLIGLSTALALLVALTAGHANAQEPATTPPDDAPSESFHSVPPSLDTGPRKKSLSPRALSPSSPQAIPNIGGGIWLAKGPGPAIDGQVENISPGPDEVVGAVHTIAAHPTDQDTLYLGGANGGVWKTTNATDTNPIWTPLTDAETSLSIGALEFDPTDTTNDTLVAGIGRYSSFGSAGGARTGLLKTSDGGASWTALSGGGTLTGLNISGVAPRGSVIVASVNDADSFACVDFGIWRSTDGGASFTSVNPFSAVPGPLGFAFDLAGDPAVPATLYTGMTLVPAFCSPGSGFTNGIYKSTDTGLTWTKVSDSTMDALIVDFTTNNIEIAVEGVHVYVNIIQDGQTVGIFHSSNSGGSWTAMDLPLTPEGSPIGISDASFTTPIVITSVSTLSGLSTGDFVTVTGVTGNTAANGVFQVTVLTSTMFELRGSTGNGAYAGSGTYAEVAGLNPRNKPGGQGGIHASIRVDPTTPTTVYIGGDRQNFPNFLGATDFSGRLFRGDTTVLASGPPQSVPSPQWEHLTHLDSIAAIPGGGTSDSSAPHADSREMVFDAGGDLIEGDDGGIYFRSSPGNNTGSWGSINGNLQVTEQHDVAYDANSNIIISGNQDTGTTQQQTPNGLTWDSISTADGGDVAVDDLTAIGVFSTRYSSFQNLGAFRRREYDTSNGLIIEAFPALFPTGALSPAPQFVTPVVANSVGVADAILIGACNAIFESFDRGDTVIEIPEIGGPIGCPESAIAYGNFTDPDAIWVGAGSSVFNRIFTGPGTPLVATPAPFPGTTVTDIVMDPSDPATAYVTDAIDVWQTHDGGITWTLITGILTDTRIGSAVIDFTSPLAPRLFVGGREGVAVAPLPAAGIPALPPPWGQIGTGLPNAPVWDMEWDPVDSVLVVGTLGRGAWVLQENGACAGGTVPDYLVVNNQWVAGTQLDEACTQITAGPSLDVTATGDLTLRAPTIVLDNGFAVKSGGKLVAENAVPP